MLLRSKFQGERIVLSVARIDERDELPQRDAGPVEIEHDAFLCL